MMVIEVMNGINLSMPKTPKLKIMNNNVESVTLSSKDVIDSVLFPFIDSAD